MQIQDDYINPQHLFAQPEETVAVNIPNKFDFEDLSNFSSAIKYDTLKVRMELLPSESLEEISKVLTYGADKYSDWNWTKGFKWSRLLGALIRHTFAWARGEDKDPETGLSHLAHAGCCILFLLYHEIHHKDLDDRYKRSE